MYITENSRKKYSNLFLETVKEIVSKEKPQVRVFLLHPSDLNDYKVINKFFDKHYIENISERKTSSDIEFSCPNVFLCYGINIEFIEKYRLLNLDDRIKFLDANICNHFIEITNFSEFEKKFQSIVKKLQTYQNFIADKVSIYSTNINKEFYEFQTRLFVNSFLVKLPGAHATDVTPFKFHSETQMKKKAEEYLTGKNNKYKLSEFKWRLLLIDDYADNGLKIDDKEEGPTKRDILEKVLRVPQKDKDEFWIKIETCSSVKDFINEFSEKDTIYDIILLDYLLEKKNNGERRYSTDILKWIKGDLIFYKNNDEIISCSKQEYEKKDKDEKQLINSNRINYNDKNKGPLGKFWFFPISVFSYAFMEDIRQMGYTYYDNDWVIARGADLVNTPELFKYSLFRFMEAQLDEVYKNIRNMQRMNHLKVKKNLLEDFIENNFSQINYKNVQKQAKKIYSSFLALLSAYRTLKKDMHNSLFAKYFIKNHEDLSYLISHFQHLLYMLAYLPAHNWTQMWDEFIIIKQYFENEKYCLTGLVNIEKYIVDLQKEIS